MAIITYYGYIGDKTPDSYSIRGIGNSRYALKPGSLIDGYSVAMKPNGARKYGLTPAVGPNGVEHASGETFVYNGKTYRWDDTPDPSTSDDVIDIYSPNHPPDKGVSAEQIARETKIMNEHGIGGEAGAANRPNPPPFKGVTYEEPSKPPEEAEDLGHEQEQPPIGPMSAPLGVQEPTITQSTQQPDTPAPQNAVKQSPVSQEEIDQIKAEGGDPEAAETGDLVIGAHSAAVAQDPNDQRVTRRINPDTGSNKIVGQYFVPGDPVHEEILSGMDPAHRAKLPLISQAIARGGPYSFMYGSAQQEGGPSEWEGERPTGESRAFEQAQSPVEQRLAGEAPQQAQRVTMLPMQMMVSKGNNPLLEGFVNDAVMNNGAHLMAGAQQAKLPVPYNGMQDPNLHKDVMGFLENQAHGFMGDGTPMVDENGQPHPLHVANQASASPYIPRLMQRPQAEFVHAMLNIRGPKNPKPPLKPPGFGERAAWQRRVNQGYAGQPAGFNNLLHKLDTHLPNVGMRNKKGKITRTVPWSEGTLEPTWRAYRPELMSQLGMPAIGTQSMRDVGAPEQIIHRAPHFRQTLAQYGPTPIEDNPEVGAPMGAPEEHSDISEASPFKKTIKAYKLFRTKASAPGKIFPMFVMGNQDVPIGSWVKAQAGPAAKGGGVKSKLGNLAYRPGFHAGDLPIATHIGGKSRPGLTKPDYRPDDHVWGEVELPADKDWQKVADANAKMTKSGNPNMATAHITDQVPHGGYYRYKTNPNMIGNWLISGDMKVNRLLNDEEVKAINDKAGVADLPRRNALPPAPIATNPEVGGPAGTPNPPGQQGLLASDVSQTENPAGAVSPQTAPEEFGGLGGESGGIDFASPNVREGMNMNMAKIALRNPKSGHGSYRDFNSRLEGAAAKASGAPEAEMRDAIGSWSDGAENSLRMLYGKQDRKTRKVVNAIRGLHSAQKQVLNFHYDDEGPHSLTSLAFHHDNPQYVSDLLDKHGIAFRTLEAPGKGQRVWAHIVDQDGSLYPKLEKLIKGGHVQDSYYRTGHADFVGDANGEDREEAAREYARILQEARSEADQRWQGRGKPSKSPRPQEWWEPFAEEAGLNYQKLKEGDELKKQQLAKDLAAADADRQNITSERAAELEQIRSTAQDWLDKNPKLHNLAVHHYLPGGTESLPQKINPKTGKPIAPDNEDIAKHFEARNARLDYSNAADRKKAAMAMTHDIMRNLAANPKSYGWYDATVDKAMDKIAEVAPEIKTDPAHAMALRLAMAVTSQGQKVVPNFESAYKIYRYWAQHGRFPVMEADAWKDQFGGGTKRDAMISNFKKLNDLWYGNEAEEKPPHTLEELKKILETEVTVGDLKREHDLNVSGEAVDHVLPGAAMLGPKIGIFYSNLNKIFHHTTMDLWFSRTLNRLAGNMFKFSPAALTKGGIEQVGDEDEEPDEKSQQSQLDRLEAVMKSGGLSGVSKEDHAKISAEMDKLRKAKDLTRLQAMEMAPTLTKYVDERHRFYQKSEGLEGSYHKSLGTEENRAAKNIDLNFHGLSDAPRTSTERKQWREVMKEVDKNLKAAGLNVNAADKQALLWYLEQGLFQGPNAKSSMDYLDAAHILARKVKNGEI